MAGRRLICSLSVIVLIACVLGVYYVYFKRPPPEELMRMNERRKTLASPESGSKDSTEHDKKNDNTDQGMMLWKGFVRENNFVSVGKVWDRGCGKSTWLYPYKGRSFILGGGGMCYIGDPPYRQAQNMFI